MSNNPYYYEEFLRHRKAEMLANELMAQHAANARAAQPRTPRFATGRMLIARIPRFRRARVAYS